MEKIIDEYEGLSGLEKYSRMVWKPFFDKEFCNIFDKDVLDVGCGDARYTYILKLNSKYRGIDIKKTSSTTEIGMAECLPYKDESFDEVISLGLLDYADVDKSLDEMFRVLKYDGCIRVMVPNSKNPYHYVSLLFGKNRKIKRRFTASEMIDLFLEKGFYIEDVVVMGFCFWVPTTWLQELLIPLFDRIDYVTDGVLGNNIFIVANKLDIVD